MKLIKKFTLQLRNKPWLISLVLIMLLAVILRFINVPDRYTFDGDAVTDAVVAYMSVKQLQLPITGNFSAAGSFTFGPWYFYHLILFYALTHLAASVWIVNGILSVVTVLVLYYLGKEIQDEKLGLIMAFLAAITPAQNAIASSSSNPNIVVLYSALTFLGLIKILRQKHTSLLWAGVIGICIGIAINAHYQALLLLIIPWYLLFFSPDQKVKRFLGSLLGIFLTFLPLLFFNLTNHWHTLRNFIYYSLHGRGLIYVPNSWTIYLRDFWPEVVKEFFGVPLPLALVIILFVGLTIAYLVITRKVSKTFLLCLFFFLISFLYLRYYWGERHTVYLYYLQPLFYLFTGYAFSFYIRLRKGRIATILFLGILAFFGLKQDVNFMQDKTYAQYTREAEYIQRQYPGKTAAIYLCNELQYDHAMAISYLLDRKGLHRKNPEVKLAIKQGNCPLPDNVAMTGYPVASHSALLQELYSVSDPFADYNFSTASEAAILSAGWKPVLIDEVYEGEVRWYFKERP